MAKPLSCFIVTIQNESGVDYKIVDEKSFTIGRSLDATIALSDANISRVHVMVVSKHDRVWIEDQGSANGTFVNGERIPGNKLTAIAPIDKIKLGTSDVEFSFNTLEKCFKKEDLVESELPKQEKESLMALVHGAHAEAQRLVKLGQDHNEKLVRAGEVKAQFIEQTAMAKRDEVIRAASDQGEQIVQECKKKGAQVIFEAEQNARQSVEEIHSAAQEARRTADQYYIAQTSAAQVKADEIIAKHTQMGKDMIQDALDKAQTKAEELEKEYLERSRIQTEKESQSVVDQVRSKAMSERDQMIAEAQLEVDKFVAKKNDIGLHIDELKKMKIQAETELKEYSNFVSSEKEKMLRERESSILKETEEILEELEKQNRKHEELRQSFIRETNEQKEMQTKEIAQAIKSKKDELVQLAKESNELSNRLDQRRKLFDEELSLQKTLKEKEANKFYEEKKQEIELLSQRKHKEVEIAKKEKEEEAQLFVQAKRLEYEKFKNETEDTIKQLETDKKNLTDEVTGQRKELEQIVLRQQESENRVRVLEPQFLKMKSEMQDFENRTNSLNAVVKDLENKKGHFSLQTQELQEKISNLKKDYDARSAEYKSKLDQEFNRLRREQEDQLDRLRHDEEKRSKKVKEELIEGLFREKEKISKEIFSSVEIEIVKIIKPMDWSTVSHRVKEKIFQTLEDRTISIAADSHGDGGEAISIPKKKRAERISYLAQGLLAGMFFLYIVQFAHHKFQEDSNPMKTAAEEDAKKRAEDLIRRKFNPPQTDELRESYVDSVIYTQNFVQNYLDEKFQNKWLKSATNYLLKQWRIEEEKTIGILSAVNSLIKTLEEKKQNIHPDFIDDGIAKMNELENESTEKLKELLGSEVKFQAFRRYEKRFYTKENAGRAPATDTPESTIEK